MSKVVGRTNKDEPEAKQQPMRRPPTSKTGLGRYYAPGSHSLALFDKTF